jgi:LPXTG-motif cell wall-anchored protein
MMNPQSQIIRSPRAAFVAMSGMALAMGLAAISAQADQWYKKTVLTIDQPMQVRETLLEPGQYVFKLLNSSSDRHIVQIYNADQTHLFNTIMAIPDYRVQVTGKSRFVMWETPAGSVSALRAWYYPGDNFGQEFPHPKHLQQIALAQTTAPPIVAQVEPARPEPAAQPQAVAQEPPKDQPVEIAQNSPPPPLPATPDPAPQPEVSSTPAALPKTASPYPLFGFSGLALLGIGGLLRRARSS